MTFQLRGNVYTLLTLRVLDPENPAFGDQLREKVAHSPDFFRDAPIILDLQALPESQPNLMAYLVDHLKEHRLVPVGVQNASPELCAEASKLGLAVVQEGSVAEARKPSAPQPSPAIVQAPKTLFVYDAVRGGQQVVSDGDLVVLAPVSAGAELAAEGSIHVYGALRGRAFAGTGGDENTMVICDQFHAELVSIAGIHQVNEDFDSALMGKRAFISCDGTQIYVQSS